MVGIPFETSAFIFFLFFSSKGEFFSFFFLGGGDEGDFMLSGDFKKLMFSE